MFPNASLCAPCMVRPNKHWSLEQRKAYCRAKPGEQVAHAHNPKLPRGFRGEGFIGKMWSRGCEVYDFFLIGWW